jgi:hypothetical protein
MHRDIRASPPTPRNWHGVPGWLHFRFLLTQSSMQLPRFVLILPCTSSAIFPHRLLQKRLQIESTPETRRRRHEHTLWKRFRELITRHANWMHAVGIRYFLARRFRALPHAISKENDWETIRIVPSRLENCWRMGVTKAAIGRCLSLKNSSRCSLQRLIQTCSPF